MYQVIRGEWHAKLNKEYYYYNTRDFIFFTAGRQSVTQYKQQWESGSAQLLFFDSTGFVDVTPVFKDCLDELAEQALHVALTARKQALQEGDVSSVSRQQQGDIRQALDYSQREGCEKYNINKTKKNHHFGL